MLIWFSFLWSISLFSCSYGVDLLEPLVTYISFNSASLSIFPSFNINETQRLNSTDADDTPLFPLQLYQVFPYFGQYVDKVYVSPNGFLQVTPNPECGAFSCSSCTGKYYGSFGGIVTDLAPFKSVNSSISSIQSNSSTIIIFSQIPILVNSTDDVSFKIAILNEGTILISYDEIPASIYSSSATCGWFSGLVAPRNHSTLITQSQMITATTVWNRNAPGIYPPSHATTQSGNIFVACPISTTWCISPSTISTVTFPQDLNLTTLSMSCYDSTGSSYVKWAITLSVAPSIYHLCEVDFLSSEDYPSGVSPAKLRCALNPDWQAFIGSATSAFVTIFWTLDSTTYHSLDEVNTLTVQLSSTDPSQSCSLNSLTPLGSCSSCQVCTGNISTCSQTICDADHSSQSTVSVFPPYDYPFDSLYIQPSCSTYETDTCKHAFDLTTDAKNQCCDVDAIDCLGICHGKAEPGYQHDGALICCEGHVDCAGVCDGKSYVDACGVCGGTDTGQKCPTYVNIETNSISSYQLLSHYNHINQTDSSQRITIHNDGNTSILVKFSLKKHSVSLDPWVELPLGLYNITNKTQQTFVISSNITRIFSKVARSWEVKTILIQYERPNQYGPLPYTIDVLPLVTDCSLISGDELCVALPGCIQCIDFSDGIRVLRNKDEQEETDVSISSDQLEELTSFYYERNRDLYSRHLYADILPSLAGISNPKEGVCRNGWRNQDCTTFVYDASSSFSRMKIIEKLFFFGMLVVLVVHLLD